MPRDVLRRPTRHAGWRWPPLLECGCFALRARQTNDLALGCLDVVARNGPPSNRFRGFYSSHVASSNRPTPPFSALTASARINRKSYSGTLFVAAAGLTEVAQRTPCR